MSEDAIPTSSEAIERSTRSVTVAEEFVRVCLHNQLTPQELAKVALLDYSTYASCTGERLNSTELRAMNDLAESHPRMEIYPTSLRVAMRATLKVIHEVQSADFRGVRDW